MTVVFRRRLHLRILVIDRNKTRASIIEEGLTEAGHAHVLIVSDMRNLMRQVVEYDPDVIIIDLENPNRDTLEYALTIARAARRPTAMFVDTTDSASTQAAIDAGVSAYIVDGLKKERVKPIIDLAITRFNATDRLRSELEAAKSELAERKVIERAKGILMRSKGLDEQAAYHLLRRTAMNQHKKIAEIAASLVTAAGLLNDEEAI